MKNPQSLRGVRFGRRLRTRMAVSYVVVTMVIVLLLESLVVGAVLFVITRSPMAGYWALQQADHAAQVIALQATIHAAGDDLNTAITFEPGQDTSIALQPDEESPNLSWFEMSIPYIEPGNAALPRPTFALVIDSREQVIASSYPGEYPAAAPLDEVIPAETSLIRAALAGESNGEVRRTGLGMHAAMAYTIWSRDRQPIGAVYVQSPAGAPADVNLLTDVAAIVLPTGVLWLILMLPIGMVFGVLATRNPVRRIERLVGATARFSDGDLGVRVPVIQADEIGQLEQQFNQMAEELVDSFTQRQALAEQSARREERARIEQEMRSARYIQESLLPEETPALPGWQVKTFYNPARDVGGDFYDFLPLPDGRLGIVIGDATGKGVPSALIMATTSAMLRAATPGEVSPGKVLGLVNSLLQGNIPVGTFATCFYAILDPASGRLSYANAGHNLPYLARAGEVRELRAVGMPLGILPGQQYEEQTVTLGAGDSILFYTDGLVEAHNDRREMFGAERIRRRVQERARADGLIDVLYQDMLAFTGPESEQEDDVTLLILRRTP